MQGRRGRANRMAYIDSFQWTKLKDIYGIYSDIRIYLNSTAKRVKRKRRAKRERRLPCTELSVRSLGMRR